MCIEIYKHNNIIYDNYLTSVKVDKRPSNVLLKYLKYLNFLAYLYVNYISKIEAWLSE